MPGPIIPPAPNLPWIALSSSSTQVGTSGGVGVVASLDTLRGIFAWPTPSLPVTTITFPVPGVVQVNAFDVDFGDDGQTAGTGYRGISRKLNGDVNTTRYSVIMPAAGGTLGHKSVLSASYGLRVAAGDTLQLLMFQDCGSSLNIAMTNLFIMYTFVGSAGSPSSGGLGSSN